MSGTGLSGGRACTLGSRQGEQGGRSICQESAYPAGHSPAIDFLVGLFLDRRISVWHVFV
jgi:hypothetical protein